MREGSHPFSWLKQALFCLLMVGAFLALPVAAEAASTISGGIYVDYDNTGNKKNFPVAGTVVGLYDSSGATELQTATTGADGTYSFTVTNASTYKVKVKTLPTGYVLHTTASLNEKTILFDGSTPNVNNDLYLFGTGGKISGKAFVDMPTAEGSLAGLNDVFGGGDVPLSGATVQLVIPGGGIIEVGANGTGDYVFDHLPPGAFTVNAPDGSEFQSASAAFWKSKSGYIGAIAVTLSGTDSTGNDFWGRPMNLSGLQGRTVNDINGDNAYITGEDLLISGVSLTLYYEDGTTPVAGISAVASVNGIYEFKPLPIGNYVVKASGAPTGYTLTQPSSGSLTVSLVGIVSPSAENNFYYNANNTLPGIAGVIFGDDDNNFNTGAGPDSGGTAYTTPTSGDVRFLNIKVDLYQKVGAVWSSTPLLTQKTKSDGTFSFRGLPGGIDYKVVMDPTAVDASYGFMNDRDGKSVAKGNAPYEITGGLMALSSYKDNQNFWFGKKGAATGGVASRVADINDTFPWGGLVNLVPSSGAWISAQYELYEEDGVTRATYADGTVIPTLSTAGSNYFAGSFLPGRYLVKVVPGSYDNRLSEIPTGGALVCAYRGAAVSQYAHFEYRGPRVISGRIFVDLNNNDVYDAGIDLPIYGAAVAIYETGGQYWGTMGSAADGTYRFTRLPEGNYSIRVGNLNYAQGNFADQIAPDPLVPLISSTVPSVAVTTGGADQSNQNIWYNSTNTDFYISGSTWMDIWTDNQLIKNGPNRYDSKLWNATIELLDSSGNVLQTTTSDINGEYKFNGLSANTTYQVRASKADMTVIDTTATSGASGGPATRTVTLGATPSVVVAQDFLLKGPGAVTVAILNDVDGNETTGDLNVEYLIQGYTHSLYQFVNGSWVLLGNTFNLPYNSSFGALEPGQYRIQANGRSLLGHTNPNDQPYIEFTITSAGEQFSTEKFIEQWTATSGAVTSGSVWLDANGNGIIDPGDFRAPGLGSAQVNFYKSYLFHPTYNTSAAISTAIAAGPSYTAPVGAGGTFSITNVASTNYFLQLSNLPSGYEAINDIDGATTPNQSWLPSFLNGGGAGVIQTPIYMNGITERDFLVKRTVPIEISGRVFYDANVDQIYNSGDQYMGAVIIELYKDGVLLVTQSSSTTDGTYKFVNLLDGNYEVRINQTGIASDLILSTDSPSSYPNMTINSSGGTYQERDFFFVKAGEAGISGRVAVDVNNSGVLELPVDQSGDLALAGVEVELFNATTGLTTGKKAVTNAKGAYSFVGGLAAGSYTVKLTGVGLGTYQPFVNATNTPPMNENRNIVLVSSIVAKQDFLMAGTSNTNPPNGPSGPGAPTSGISGHLFVDLNTNNEYDTGEPTLSGIKIELMDSSNKTIAIYTTDSNGKYQFFNLDAGSYKVNIYSATPGYILAGNRDGNTTATLNVTVGSSGVDRRDFWFKQSSIKGIEGVVYYDALRDSLTASAGTVNANDVPLAGVVLELYSGTGGGAVSTGTTSTTDADGKYSFPGLIYGSAANYTVKIKTLPAGYAAFGTSEKGSTAPLDAIEVLALPAAGVDGKLFFLTGTYSLGDLVWKDVDNSGTYNAGDTGIGGVEVGLIWAGPDGVIGTADDIAYTTPVTTSATGAYSFSNLAPGKYQTKIDTAAAANVTALTGLGLIPSSILAGNVNPQEHTITTANITTADFGFRVMGGISGYVHYDNNANGTYDLPTPDGPIAGMTITLTKPDSTTVTTTTDAAGKFEFTGLPLGTYTVVMSSTIPNGYVFSYDYDDPMVGTQAGTPNSASVTLAVSAPDVTTVNFGYKSATGINGTVSVDIDGNHAKNIPVDTALNGIVVERYLGATLWDTATTNASGAYSFPSVSAGTWTLRVQASTIPAGYTLSYDPNSNTSGTGEATVTVTAGDANKTNVDFGYLGNSTITGKLVYDNDDTDGNGYVSGTDTLFAAGYTVTLNGGSGFVSRTVTTNASGEYSFTGLGIYSDYKVVVSAPTGFVSSFDPDSAAVTPPTPPTGDGEATIAITALSQSLTDKDFGFKGSGKIEGRLYLDVNDNGIYDIGTDTDLAGLTVTLTDGTITRTMVSDAAGKYSFTGVPKGDWQVTVSSVPADYAPSFDYDDSFNARSLPISPNQARIDSPTNAPDISIVDFAYIHRGQMGGVIKEDQTASGIYNVSAPGIAGVSVYLLQSDGVTPVLDSNGQPTVMITDANGEFSLRNLVAPSTGANYKLRVDFGSSSMGALKDYEPSYDSDAAIGMGGLVNWLNGTHVITANLPASGIRDFTNLYLGYRSAAGDLTITKKAAKGTAKVGEIVPYTIIITNNNPTSPALNVVIEDLIPAGFKYVAGTARLDGEKIADPTGGRPLTFEKMELGAKGGINDERKLTYFLIVGTGVTPGDYVNTAVAKNALSGKVSSNTSSATVKVTGDPLFDDSLIFGKVYIDTNGNGKQDEEERGLGGVKLITGRGEIITTDQEGRYHLTDVSGGRWERGTNFILKLDVRSLPKGYKVISDNPIVVRLSPGIPSRVNFAVQEKKEKQAQDK